MPDNPSDDLVYPTLDLTRTSPQYVGRTDHLVFPTLALTSRCSSPGLQSPTFSDNDSSLRSRTSSALTNSSYSHLSSPSRRSTALSSDRSPTRSSGNSSPLSASLSYHSSRRDSFSTDNRFHYVSASNSNYGFVTQGQPQSLSSSPRSVHFQAPALTRPTSTPPRSRSEGMGIHSRLLNARSVIRGGFSTPHNPQHLMAVQSFGFPDPVDLSIKRSYSQSGNDSLHDGDMQCPLCGQNYPALSHKDHRC